MVNAIAVDKTYIASGDDKGGVQIYLLYNHGENEFSHKIEVEGGRPVTHLLFSPNANSIYVSTTGPDVAE